MRADTALTILCGVSILVIVGMVMLTAFNVGLSGAVSKLTGKYIPVGYGRPVERGEFVRARVSPDDPFCFQNAVAECKRLNSGPNFVQCTDQASYDCGQGPLLSTCVLPAGFEIKYVTKNECLRGVQNECSVRCAKNRVGDCVSISKGRCELIGGRFTPSYETRKYLQYPSREFGTT